MNTRRHQKFTLSIGDVARRTGLTTSALRFYEEKALIGSARTPGNQRCYTRDVIRRVSFVRAAQRVGLSLEEIRAVLDDLPAGRAPTREDWHELARRWKPWLDERIASTNGISRARSSQRPAVTRSAASRVVKLTGGNEYDLSRASPPPRPCSPITGIAAARRPLRNVMPTPPG